MVAYLENAVKCVSLLFKLVLLDEIKFELNKPSTCISGFIKNWHSRTFYERTVIHCFLVWIFLNLNFDEIFRFPAALLFQPHLFSTIFPSDQSFDKSTILIGRIGVWTELGVVSRLLPRPGSPRKRLRFVDFFRKLFWRHLKFSSRIDSLLLFLILLLLAELFFRHLNQFFFCLGKIPVRKVASKSN